MRANHYIMWFVRKRTEGKRSGLSARFTRGSGKTDMKIIKRSGSEVPFDRTKIAAAVEKANRAGGQAPELSAAQVEQIAGDLQFAVPPECVPVFFRVWQTMHS